MNSEKESKFTAIKSIDASKIHSLAESQFYSLKCWMVNSRVLTSVRRRRENVSSEKDFWFRNQFAQQPIEIIAFCSVSHLIFIDGFFGFQSFVQLRSERDKYFSAASIFSVLFYLLNYFFLAPLEIVQHFRSIVEVGEQVLALKTSDISNEWNQTATVAAAAPACEAVIFVYYLSKQNVLRETTNRAHNTIADFENRNNDWFFSFRFLD